MIAWLMCFALLILVVALYAYINAPITDTHTTTKETIETLLDPPDLDEQAKLLARALPNNRLIPAFGVHGTFVSDNPSLHRLSVNHTKQLLRRWSDDWDQFAKTANFFTQKYIRLVRGDPTGITTLPFDTFVQTVTLAVILVSLFETDASLLHFDDVAIVAKNISERWRDLESDAELSGDTLDDIKEQLSEWAPNAAINPLEYLIHSYETMWRVVAFTLAEECRSTRAHTTCDRFLDNPDMDNFKREYGNDYSVHAMIQESLRLHPPIRRISRAIEIQPPILRKWLEVFGVPYRSQGVADIETFQRSLAWGPNPDVFDPSRHTLAAVENDPNATLFAFGHGSMQCVATTVAPHAAGIIFAAIMAGVPPSGRCIIDDGGGSIDGPEGWNKWTIRMSTI